MNSAVDDRLRTLRVAAVQMPSENGRRDANLACATRWVEQAAGEGAQLILLPEFMSGGYSWTRAIWKSAEGQLGPTVAWLRETSHRLGVWLGTSYLEAEAGHFYNTFVLTGPDGAEAGRVRKQTPAMEEAYFFRGDHGPHLIETPIGRIGVGICHENYMAYLPRLMQRGSADLMLMPHSAPCLSEAFLLGSRLAAELKSNLQSVARYYAQSLGIPVVMANKCGPWESGLFYARPATFLGCSAIADSDGRFKRQLAGEEQAIVADVTLDPARKVAQSPPTHGRWARPTPRLGTLACWIPESIGGLCYRFSWTRRARVRAALASHSNDPQGQTGG